MAGGGRRNAVRRGDLEQPRVQGAVIVAREPARGRRGAGELGLALAQHAEIPAVRREAEDLGEAVTGQRAGHVREHRAERVLGERERAGEREVLRGRAESQRRQAQRARHARAEALGQRIGDPGVGGEGQVRPVLLGGAEGQHGEPAAGRERALELGPGEASERGLRLDPAQGPAAELGAQLVERRVRALARPGGGLDPGVLHRREYERPEPRLVLEDGEKARQRRVQHHQRVSLGIEHRLEAREARPLVRGIRAREREQRGRLLRERLEGPVRELDRVGDGRRRLQQPLDELQTEVVGGLAIDAAREQQHGLRREAGSQARCERSGALERRGEGGGHARELWSTREPQRAREAQRGDVARDRPLDAQQASRTRRRPPTRRPSRPRRVAPRPSAGARRHARSPRRSRGSFAASPWAPRARAAHSGRAPVRRRSARRAGRARAGTRRAARSAPAGRAPRRAALRGSARAPRSFRRR